MPRPATSRRTRLVVRAAFVLGGLGLLLGGAELALRIRFPLEGYIVGKDLYEPDPNAGYRLRPGAWVGGVRINSMGYADHELAREKPPGEYRVVVTGDSFTFPDTFTDSYVEQLERNLGLAHPAHPIEVVNASVIGYGIAQELARYSDRDRTLAPDAVVLGLFIGNDVTDEVGPGDVTAFAGDIVSRSELERVRHRWFGLYPFARACAARSWLVTYLRGAIERPDPHRGIRPDALAFEEYVAGRASWSETRNQVIRAAGWLAGPLGTRAAEFMGELERRLPQAAPTPESLAQVRAAAADTYGDLLSASLAVTQPAIDLPDWEPFYLFEPATYPRWNEILATSVETVEKFANAVRADHARFLVLLIPDRLQVDGALLARLCERTGRNPSALDLDAPQRVLTARYRGLGIESLDLLPRFRNEERDAALYLEHDLHWNHRGKRIAAEELFRRIEQEGWVR